MDVIKLKGILGTSLVAQWLKLHLPMHGVLVQSLVGDLRSHRPRGQKSQNIKQEQYFYEFNTLKNGPHKKKILKRKQRNPSEWALVLSQHSPGQQNQ